MENEGATQNGTSPSANNLSGEESLLASKLAELERTVGAFDYQNKKLEDRVTDLLNEIGILKEEKQSVLSQKEDLETQLVILKGEIESLKEDKIQLQSQNKAIGSQLTADIERLGKLLSEKEDLDTELQKEKTQLQNQNEALKSQLNVLLSEKDELLTKLENFNKGLEVLRKENVELREDIFALNKFKDDTLGNLVTEKEDLVSELMNMKGEFESLKDEKGSLQGRLAEALEQVSEMEKENASLQRQLGEMKEKHVSLQGQLGDAVENSHLRSENAILQKNMQDISAESRRQLDALEEECFRLQEETKKQRIEIDLLHTLKSSMVEEKDVLGKKLEGEASRRLEAVGGDCQQINVLENQLNTVSSEKKDLEDVNFHLENEVKRLALAVEEQDKLKARIKEFEVNFEAVKIDLETKDNTIQQLTLELKALQHSPEIKQKRSLIWPAVLASGSLGMAAAFGYLKFSKRH